MSKLQKNAVISEILITRLSFHISLHYLMEQIDSYYNSKHLPIDWCQTQQDLSCKLCCRNFEF